MRRPDKRARSRGTTWMVTYADMMALLLCLFILLLSFSEIDSTSFRRNAGPIRHAFNAQIVVPRMKTAETETVWLPPIRPDDYVEPEESRVYRVLQHAMEDEITRNIIELDTKDKTVIIRFPGTAAFPSGSADLSESFMPTLEKVRHIIAQTEGRVLVAGHTDDTPIATDRYRSNWDLSSARAVSVVHELLKEEAILPRRLSAQGLGESRPRVPNDTPENKALNRRVEITIELPTSPK
jgi:chemotaxis protein MotB